MMHALQEVVYVNTEVLQQTIAAAKLLAREKDKAEYVHRQNSKKAYQLYELECQLSAQESRLKEQLDNTTHRRS